MTGSELVAVPIFRSCTTFATGCYAVPGDVDLFVNATSIGLYPDVEAMPDVDLGAAAPGTLVCDVVFNPPETPLLRAARRRESCPRSTACRCWSTRESSRFKCRPAANPTTA